MQTVLVVDDDTEIRETLSDLLLGEGFDVRTAGNGREALRFLESLRDTPCVMLLDMMMPIMSGGELLDVLERTHRLDQVPVIVLTASASNVARARAVLHKPASLDRILAEVHGCFAKLGLGTRSRAARSNGPPTPLPSAHEPDDPPLRVPSGDPAPR